MFLNIDKKDMILFMIVFWISSLIIMAYRCESHKQKKQPQKTKLNYTKYNVYY